MAVTRRQKEVLDFLTEFVRKNEYSPSYDEIARGLGLKSLATVHKHITNLTNKGILQREHNRSRSIDVIPTNRRNRVVERLPLLGRIAAGQPVETSQPEETLSLGDIVGSKEAFALRVRGDSMRDEHIVDGDYVLVERTSVARQGEIIVALVKGSETTLKRYYIEGSMVRLQPSNTEMDPIYVPIQNVAIQGKVSASSANTKIVISSGARSAEWRDLRFPAISAQQEWSTADTRKARKHSGPSLILKH